MRTFLVALLIVGAVLARGAQAAEPSQAPNADEQAIDLMQLLEQTAPRLKKRFIVDPRLRGDALLVNVDPQQISYADLQSILSVHGFVTAEETNGTVRIVPDANARQLPMPLLAGARRKVGDEEMVTKVLDATPLKATELVPLLRPLLPQYAHLVGHADTNTLTVVARHGNVRMIESIVEELRGRRVAEPK